MNKMTKQQIIYLTDRISVEANKAISAYEKEHPTQYTSDQKRDMLAKALDGSGISPSRDNYAIGYFTFPDDPAFEQNGRAVQDFAEVVKAEKQRAIDAVNLNDSPDASAILTQFIEAIRTIQR